MVIGRSRAHPDVESRPDSRGGAEAGEQPLCCPGTGYVVAPRAWRPRCVPDNTPSPAASCSALDLRHTLSATCSCTTELGWSNLTATANDLSKSDVQLTLATQN